MKNLITTFLSLLLLLALTACPGDKHDHDGHDHSGHNHESHEGHNH